MKYKFNHKSLSFEVEEVSATHWLKKILAHLATAVAFAVVCLLVYTNFFTSPKEKQLKRELEETELQVRNLDRRVNTLSHVLKDMEEKDDNMYRAILDAEPVGDRDQWVENESSSFSGKVNSESLQHLSRKVDILTARTQKQLLSYEEIWKMVKNKETHMACIPAISPVRNPKVISGFGMRYHPIYKILRSHTGIDLVGKRGQAIYATADGVVSSENPGSGYGNTVVINHGNGYKTVYAHLLKTAVSPGKKVKRGEVIGYMGSSGLASGTHLHYEVIKNGQRVNPVHFFYGDLTPEEYNQILQDASVVNQALS